MKEVHTQESMPTQTLLQSARWYLATTLTERLSLLQHNTTRQLSLSEEQREKAVQRLKQWKSQPPLNRSEQSFARRLALDGLTEEKLLALLAQPAEEIEALFSVPPPWLVELKNAFEQQDTSALDDIPFDKLEDPNTRTICRALKPLLASGFKRLREGIAKIQEGSSRLPFDPQTIHLLLLPHLLNQLMSKLTKTLVLELNVARVQGRLQGETPGQRFDYFLQQLTQPENLLALLEEYPVLARHLVERIDGWVNCELELLQRLSADWDELCSIFSPTDDPGILTEIQEGAGDMHQGGHSVVLLTWKSGLRLAYKPRSLATDVHFQEVLAWLNERGCQPALRTMKVLQKESYGWCEFVFTRECASKEEIQRFYQRLGGYLALLYTLEATDFHAQNLLAAGEDPMLIDLESLFHQRAEGDDDTDANVSNLFKYSVRRVGMLPERIWSDQAGGGIDLSGLVGQTGQLTPFGVPTLKGQGTDEMHMIKERVEVKLGDHRPSLEGQEIDTHEFEKNVLVGFTTVYQLLLKHRDDFLTTILPRFARDEARVLLRQTQNYTMMQADSFHPNILRDALDRDRFADRLWLGVEQYPYLERLIPTERAELLDDDTPKFTTRPISRDLFTARGEIIPDFFPESSMNHAKQCVQNLSEQDLERQIWLIKASFASLTLNAAHSMPKSGLQLLPAQSNATYERVLNESMAIGNRLHELASTWQDMAGWMIMNVVGGQEWRPTPASLDLYSGLPGIALFLANLGKISGEERYTGLARATLKTLQVLVRALKRSWGWPHIGAYDGAGSLVYLFSHLGSIWHEPDLYQEAEEIAAQIPELISKDELFDVMNGSAGAIAALLSLYTVAPSESTLKVAVQCGEHLLDHARSMPQGIGWTTPHQTIPLAGLSHGNAGIALNLLRLAAVSKEERFRQAALEALAYERSTFSPEHGNWPDLRESPASAEKKERQVTQEQELAFMTAWCHGAVGVGLARLASLPYLDDAIIHKEIQAAVQATLAKGFGRNHSLCHGDMGSLELLFSAAQLLPGTYSREAYAPLQAALLENMAAQGWQSGLLMGTETPSLMLGLAGTGYALLRQIAPEQVPSVLVLDPPRPL